MKEASTVLPSTKWTWTPRRRTTVLCAMVLIICLGCLVYRLLTPLASLRHLRNEHHPNGHAVALFEFQNQMNNYVIVEFPDSNQWFHVDGPTDPSRLTVIRADHETRETDNIVFLYGGEDVTFVLDHPSGPDPWRLEVVVWPKRYENYFTHYVDKLKEWVFGINPPRRSGGPLDPAKRFTVHSERVPLWKDRPDATQRPAVSPRKLNSKPILPSFPSSGERNPFP